MKSVRKHASVLSGEADRDRRL